MEVVMANLKVIAACAWKYCEDSQERQYLGQVLSICNATILMPYQPTIMFCLMSWEMRMLPPLYFQCFSFG
jgi:hypothetical protein